MEQTGTTPTDGRPPANAAAPAPQVMVRELPVAVGQTLQATVAAIEGDKVWLGWRGAVFEARTQQLLEAGKSYDFVVAATEPHILLGAARMEAAAAVASVAVKPSRGGAELLRALVALIDRLPPSVAQGGSAAKGYGEALAAFAAGKASAADLQVLQRGLGHDQEARVLRLSQLAPEQLDGEVASLRTTRKAAALALLAEVASDDKARAGAAKAHALVSGLNVVERDNARRADAGLPLWLPLPACPEQGLHDARMFMLHEGAGGEAEAARAAGGAFTVVLLLDLSRLGELRVDVALRGERVDVTFVAVQPSATAVLVGSMDELRAGLTAAGLAVERLSVRQAKGATLPVADLVLPPTDGTAMVDCHA